MDRRQVLVGLGAVLLASACGSSPTGPGPVVEPPPPPPPPPPAPVLGITRILAFGDSMTAGTISTAVAALTARDAGLPASYPFKLQEALRLRYSSQTIEVFNAGVPGENANPTGRDRLGRTIADTRPELVLLMEGANDLNLLLVNGQTSVTGPANAIEDMVRESERRGVPVMVATIPPQRAGGKGTDPDLLRKFNNEIRTMAPRKGATLVDINEQVPLSLIGQDGLHPTDAGYARIAEIFMDAIRQRHEAATSSATP